MIFCIVQSIAFVTLLERHLLGSSQIRLGPNKVSIFGLVQAFLDGVKLLKKRIIFPNFSFKMVFFLLPTISFLLMMFYWFIIPYFYYLFTFGYSFLFFFSLIGFSVYPIILRGIFSFSKYSFIGSLRSASQSISYEITFSFYMLIFLLFFFGLELISLNMFIFFFLILIFFFLILAELNRAPFDFAEGESELVSGFNIEFSSVPFVLFFLAEYGILLFFCVFISIFFFNFSLFFSFVFFFLVIFVRSCYPRFRYDFLIGLFWFKFLPISLFLYFFYMVFFFF